MVQIIPKEKKKRLSLEGFIFYFSLILLFLSFLSYFSLLYLTARSVKIKENLEMTLAKERTKEEISLENKILKYQDKINNFSLLIKEHPIVSNFFPLLEKNCHPKIWFSNFVLSPTNQTATLSGQAESFSVLSHQLQIFNSLPEIENLDLSNLSLNKAGQVSFTINLSLKENLFK